LNTLTFFLQFINISFLITSIIFLFKYFRNNSEVKISNEGYKQFIKKFSLKSIALFSVILPIVIVLNSFSKPTVALSFSFFGVTVIVLLLLLLVSSLGYLMLKEDSVKYVNAVVFIFVLSYSLLVVREQYTFDTATKSHFAFLSNEYDTYEMKLKQEAGLVKVSISGEEIYNGKCIACHQFDRRVVGPAHNDVLPKYEGKKDALVKFILNPVKVNPEYPAMPNQGLKPNEAEAVADYMLTHYKKK
jgi:cytochrome c